VRLMRCRCLPPKASKANKARKGRKGHKGHKGQLAPQARKVNKVNKASKGQLALQDRKASKGQLALQDRKASKASKGQLALQGRKDHQGQLGEHLMLAEQRFFGAFLNAKPPLSMSAMGPTVWALMAPTCGSPTSSMARCQRLMFRPIR